MACMCRDSQLVAFDFQVEHKRLHTRRYCPEIVVFKLLVFSTLMTHEGTAGHNKVGTRRIQSLIDQEILLFPSKIRQYMTHIFIEIACHIGSGLVNRIKGT